MSDTPGKKNPTPSRNGGLGIVGTVTVVLIVLKLAEVDPVAGWSWPFVLLGPWVCSLVAWMLWLLLLIFIVQSEEKK